MNCQIKVYFASLESITTFTKTESSFESSSKPLMYSGDFINLAQDYPEEYIVFDFSTADFVTVDINGSYSLPNGSEKRELFENQGHPIYKGAKWEETPTFKVMR